MSPSDSSPSFVHGVTLAVPWKCSVQFPVIFHSCKFRLPLVLGANIELQRNPPFFRDPKGAQLEICQHLCCLSHLLDWSLHFNKNLQKA